MIGERVPVRERLRSMERRELAGLAVLGVIVLAGAALWYARSLPGKISVELSGGPGSRQFGAQTSPSPSPSVIVVYVTGWVHKPGVYELHQGERVIDAIRLAGGTKRGADLTTVNLAAFLTDAQQITVARRGPGPPAGGGTGGGASGAGGVGQLVNINTATLEELESLPGIGPALGQRIIDYREQHGPFRSVDDLLNVSGIGDKRLADLRSKVTV